MDFIKKATGGEQSQSTGQTGQKDDYADKGFAAGAKKAGINLPKDQQEKVTDAGRDMFEKSTGKNVPDKFSN